MTDKHDDPAAAGDVPAPVLAQHAPVTDRINAEPPILNGMTSSEGMRIGVLCLIGYAIAGGFLYAISGWWQVMMVVTLFGTGITVWYASIYLAKIKRGRPEGYYGMALSLWIAAQGLTRSAFLLRTGYWSLGRDMPFGGFTSPLVVHESAARRQPKSEPGTRKRQLESAGVPRTGAAPFNPIAQEAAS